MISVETGTRFGTPDRGREASSRPGKGRRCADPACPTVLSTYNPSDTCYLHTEPTYRHPLART
jgi:hypothetical protein